MKKRKPKKRKRVECWITMDGDGLPFMAFPKSEFPISEMWDVGPYYSATIIYDENKSVKAKGKKV